MDPPAVTSSAANPLAARAARSIMASRETSRSPLITRAVAISVMAPSRGADAPVLLFGRPRLAQPIDEDLGYRGQQERHGVSGKGGVGQARPQLLQPLCHRGILQRFPSIRLMRMRVSSTRTIAPACNASAASV